MIYLELIWSFIKIGFTSFGGFSMIPLISTEMASHGWMTSAEISDIVAIAEMTPGPLGLNCATFAGMKTAGILGAVSANMGMLTPTFTVALLAAVFFERFSKSDLMQQMMVGVRPVCVGMVLGAVFTLATANYVRATGINIPAVILGIADFFLLYKLKLSIPKVIGVSAAAGLLIFGVLGM
jgi:chromate transporter